jgi:hypothetical protein
VNEVVTPISVKDLEDLNWTIERLHELAKEQKTTELTRVLKVAVRAPATSSAEERTMPRTDSETLQKRELS